MSNFNRLRTKAIISLSPGIHLRELQKALGTSFSTTRYHVDGLQRNNEITSSSMGRYQRLFPKGMSEKEMLECSALQQKAVRRVLLAIVRASGGMSNGEISEACGLPKSSVAEYTAILVDASIVRRSISVGGQALYDVPDRERIAHLLAWFEKNLLSIATGNFIDFWDL